MENNTLRVFVLMVGACIFGGLILFTSVTKASLINASLKIDDKDARTVPISFEVKKPSGEKIKGEYKVPIAGMLPTNQWYWLKEVRNWLWTNITVNGPKRTMVIWFIADKLLSESIVLKENGWEQLSWQVTNKAVAMLGDVRDRLEVEVVVDSEQRIFQLNQAIPAYSEVVGAYLKSIEIDKQLVEETLRKLDSWYEEY